MPTGKRKSDELLDTRISFKPPSSFSPQAGIQRAGLPINCMGMKRQHITLTRDFKETVQGRMRADPAFRVELLREGIETLLDGDVGTGKTILRDYIRASASFEKLGVNVEPKLL